MAIWVRAEEIQKLHGELLDAFSNGEAFVVFEAAQNEYRALDFISVINELEAGEILGMFANGKVLPVGLMIVQLETALDRGLKDWIVLPDFEPMGMAEGNIFSDLKMMGLKEPALEEMIYEKLDDQWAEIELKRQIGDLEVGLRLYRVDINGRPRIPEFALFVPKSLESMPQIESPFGISSAAIEYYLDHTTPFHGSANRQSCEDDMSIMDTAIKANLFLADMVQNDPEFDLRCQVLATLLQRFPMGRAVEQMLISIEPQNFNYLYHQIPFPYTVKVDRILEITKNPSLLMDMSREAYKDENLKKAIMEAKNLENLKEEMTKLGFSEKLIGQMEAKMASNEPRFILYDTLESDKGRVELGLHFNQSKNSEYYYFNKFDAVLEKQPPLEPGEKYFVSSQRQGEEVQLREFEMPSLAVKLFNSKLEASKEIRGTAEIYAGVDVDSGKKLVSMADGKVIDVEKDFYKTLMNPSIGQTTYLEKGNGFTLEQSVNMVAGRSVQRDNILDIHKNEYSAWAKLDFDKGRDKGGNFPIKTFTEGYGFDLSKVLDRFDFKELANSGKREELEASLRNGNRAEVTVDLDGKKEKLLAVAVPEFKQINLYSLDGKSIKRENHVKEEKVAEVSLGKEKGHKKDKSQDLSV